MCRRQGTAEGLTDHPTVRAARVQYLCDRRHGIPCLTSLDTAKALLLALASKKEGQTFDCLTIDQYLRAER